MSTATTNCESALSGDDPIGMQRCVPCPDRVNLVERYDYPDDAVRYALHEQAGGEP